VKFENYDGYTGLVKLAPHNSSRHVDFASQLSSTLFTEQLHVVYCANAMHREWTSRDVDALAGVAPPQSLN